MARPLKQVLPSTPVRNRESERLSILSPASAHGFIKVGDTDPDTNGRRSPTNIIYMAVQLYRLTGTCPHFHMEKQ